MREIKFRAWDKKEKWFIEPNMFQISGDGRLTAWFDGEGEDYLISQEDLILTQYTGLKDKNGVEIYEGDIIKQIDNLDPSDEDFWKYEVVKKINWSCGCCNSVYGYTFEKIDFYTDSWIVIGNIYENPELLKL